MGRKGHVLDLLYGGNMTALILSGCGDLVYDYSYDQADHHPDCQCDCGKAAGNTGN